MEVTRPIKRRRDEDVVLSAEIEDVVVKQCQVRRDHKDEVALLDFVSPLCGEDDLSYKLEVQQRLTALEFDLERRRRRVEGQLERPLRGLPAHVELAAVTALSRDLAIRAGVLTPK